MGVLAANQAFEEAIKVTPVDTHRYSVVLQDDWCIGTVPHGGYTSAVLYRLAITHFAHTHPTRYKGEAAAPISMQLAFLRRTSTGPAVLKVEDTKLGARTSTIHVTLLQPREKKNSPASPPGWDDEDLEIKVAGYITVSSASAEVGMSAPSGWQLLPAAVPGSGPEGRVDLQVLGQSGRDGRWVRLATPFPQFRRAATQVETFGPDPAQGEVRAVDQWARFRPGGANGRWTDEAVAYLVDIFPMALDKFDGVGKATPEGGAQETKSAAAKEEPQARYWYPTVTLNIDFKKRLPAGGVEWLYSRVQTRSVRDGRTDLDVTVLDAQGEVVALSNQVGLVVSTSRNIGQRKSKM